MRKLLAALLASWPCISAADFGFIGHPVVIELYTSQGCSSCPPADKFLLELLEDRNRNILPLSFHVDYWNSLGWEDTFSQPSFSDRQRNYARHYGRRTIYTPQMVIDGRAFVVGSRKSEVNEIIDGLLAKKARIAPDNEIRLKNCKDSAKRRITVEGNPNMFRGKEYTLYFLTVRNRVESVKISRGENARRAISYGNVVKGIRKLAWSDNKFGTAEFSADIDRDVHFGIALLQRSKFGPILAAAEIVDTDCADLEQLALSESKEAAKVASEAMGVSVWADAFVSGEWHGAAALNAGVIDSHGEHRALMESFDSVPASTKP